MLHAKTQQAFPTYLLSDYTVGLDESSVIHKTTKGMRTVGGVSYANTTTEKC